MRWNISVITTIQKHFGVMPKVGIRERWEREISGLGTRQVEKLHVCSMIAIAIPWTF